MEAGEVWRGGGISEAGDLAEAEIERFIGLEHLLPGSLHFRACGTSEKDVDYMAQAFLPECFFFEKPVGE